MYFPVEISILFNKNFQWHARCQWKKEYMGIKITQVKQRGRSWKVRKSWWTTQVVSMEFFSSSFIWKLAILLCNLDDFDWPLRRDLTPEKEMGVCTSPNTIPWPCAFGLTSTLFSLKFYIFSGGSSAFVHDLQEFCVPRICQDVWVCSCPAGWAPSSHTTASQPLPHSHHKQFPS